jgi:catalase
MMFAIRDALEYGGLLPNRKKIPAREIKLALYKFKFLTDKTEHLNKVLASLEDQN